MRVSISHIEPNSTKFSMVMITLLNLQKRFSCLEWRGEGYVQDFTSVAVNKKRLWTS